MQVKNRLLGFFMAIALITISSIIAEAEEYSQQKSCTAVARLFGQTVCHEEISTEQQHLEAIKQQYEEQGLDSEQAVKSRNRERLKDALWTIALHRKFGPEKFKPTAEEIYLYSKGFKESLRRSHEENLKTAARIKSHLKHRTYTAEEERELKNLLTTIETSIAFYNERQKNIENMPPEFSEMVAEAERGIAKTMIREWKINKALYEEYGGALVLQQGTLQPAEAYGKFLDYIRTEGQLEILDPAYENVFTATALFAAGPHKALPEEDKALYEGYFSSPYWHFEHYDTLQQDALEN